MPLKICDTSPGFAISINIAEVTAVSQQQLKGTEAKISCIVNRPKTELDGVKWSTSDNSTIISGNNGFIIDQDGTLSGNSQTTVLTVPAAANTEDTTYNCLITTNEYGKVLEERSSVSLKVFSEYQARF